MVLIIETDLGRDPDDLWAILYLIASGIEIKAITISPGYKDQVALAHFLRDQLGLNYLIGSSKFSKNKNTITTFHRKLLRRFGYQEEVLPDGEGDEIIEKTLKSHQNTEFLVIGPLDNLGKFLLNNTDSKIKKVTMQGGFIGYDVHEIAVRRLKKIEGKTKVPTFNLNCSRHYAKVFLEANNIRRTFVGKHLCHSIVLDEYSHSIIMSCKPNNFAAELFQYSIDNYFLNHSKGKKFHDPVAAVVHNHMEITKYVKAKLFKQNGELGAYLDNSGDEIVVDIDRKKFWELVSQFE